MTRSVTITRLIGFLILYAFVLVLFTTTLINLATTNLTFFIALTFFMIGTLYTGYKVFIEEVYKKTTLINTDNSLMVFLAVVIGSFTAYGLHYFLSCPVLGAAIVGLLGAIFVKSYQVPIYTGAFVGMSSVLLFGVWPFVFATLLAGIIFVLTKDIFNGYGGKLGTIALSGATLSTLMLRGTFTEGSLYNLTQQLTIIGLSILAAVLTYVISIRFKRGPVFASALVGVIAGILLPIITSQFGHVYAVVIIGASFVGMSAKTRFANEIPIFVGGTLFGLIFIYSAPYFGGAGGKLGTIAFVSGLSVKGMMMIKNKIVPKIEKC